VSKVKNPELKKKLSLEKDRRNTYRENSKASRKSIPRRKQLRHMDERKGVAQVLNSLVGSVDDDRSDDAELEVKARITDSRNRGFKKKPDEPLGIVLARKKPKKKAAKKRK
jgi:hypothetical protein